MQYLSLKTISLPQMEFCISRAGFTFSLRKMKHLRGHRTMNLIVNAKIRNTEFGCFATGNTRSHRYAFRSWALYGVLAAKFNCPPVPFSFFVRTPVGQTSRSVLSMLSC